MTISLTSVRVEAGMVDMMTMEHGAVVLTTGETRARAKANAMAKVGAGVATTVMVKGQCTARRTWLQS
jgi:hypothetical protein